MTFSWDVLVLIAVLPVTYLLIVLYMRRRDGVQPDSRGFLIMLTAAGCGLLGFYVLEGFGLNFVEHGRTRDIFFLVLRVSWLFLAFLIVYRRQSSGAVLMD